MPKTLPFKRFLTLLMLASLVLLVGCTTTNADNEDTAFTWWITDTDSKGTFYTTYEENPVMQWINNQYWDPATGTHSDDEIGSKVNLSFMSALKGSESDNFNTMIATGSYPEIIDLSYSDDSPKALVEDGVLMEITDYVEQYMPNYLSYIEEHPELKPFMVETDENGKDHYYFLQAFSDSPIDKFEGYMYRRDWLVKYAQPTSHVWDLESDFVVTNGHPKYTPLSVAQANQDLTGWKVNPVSAFTSNYGDEDTWEDNVIFPSGTDIPLYISDWEWMLGAFKTAIETEGFGDDSNAYPTTMYYLGYMETGALVSSFGGGAPLWYKDGNGDAAFGGTGSHFRSYLEAMHTWYVNGWLDENFETRVADMFFKINLNGVSQGKVGLWDGSKAFLGTTIRTTAANEDAQEDAMVFGAALPINDVYGDDSNKFKEPDTFYGGGLLSASSVGITTKASEKDLVMLFTMFNWLYSFEGALSCVVGLSQEQYDSMTFSPDLYAEYGITTAYTVHEANGKTIYVNTVPSGNVDLSSAVRGNRLGARLEPYGSDTYEHDRGYSMVDNDGVNIQWKRYENTGYILDYNSLMGDEQSALLSRTRTYVNDLMGSEVPAMIENGLGGWDAYVSKINKYGPSRVTTLYQDLIDSIQP